MPSEIRIYFEGSSLLKPGFCAFFREISECARQKRCGFKLISARSGDEAERDFEIALREHRSAWPILLRDSEGPARHRSKTPHADRTFWMVEMMEAWFHADKDALAGFYGEGFKKTSLKPNPKVETISKQDLVSGLRAATRRTKQGDYFNHKTSHGPKLLSAIDASLVRAAAPNCERLSQAVLAHLE